MTLQVIKAMVKSPLVIFTPVLLIVEASGNGGVNFKIKGRGRVSHYFAGPLATGEGVRVNCEASSDEIRNFYYTTSHGGEFNMDFNVGYLPNFISITAGTETRVLDVSNIDDVCVYQQPTDPTDRRFAAISDIDDTMLETGSGRNALILFLKLALGRYREVNGVAAFYTALQLRGVDFFYLSNSATSFYTSIAPHLRNFPKAPCHLKHYQSLKSISEWHKKTAKLNEIIAGMPRSQFFLFGDNTSQDLSVYQALAQRYPNRIHTIYIRKVPKGRLSLPALRNRFQRGRQPDPEEKPVESEEHLVKDVDVISWNNVAHMETDCQAQMRAGNTLCQKCKYIRFHFWELSHDGRRIASRTETVSIQTSMVTAEIQQVAQ